MAEFVLFTKVDGFSDLDWTWDLLFGDEAGVVDAYADCGFGTSSGVVDTFEDGLAGVSVYFGNGATKTPINMFALVDVWSSSACLLNVFVPTASDYFALLNELRGHIALAQLHGSVEDRKQRIQDELKNG